MVSRGRKGQGGVGRGLRAAPHQLGGLGSASKFLYNFLTSR